MKATFSEIIDRLGGGAPSGDGYVTLCPAHEDTNPSLVVTLKDDGRVLMHCRSQNCSFTDIVTALDMEPSDFVEVEAGGDLNISSGASVKMPPTNAHLRWLNSFIEMAHSNFFGSPAEIYAEQRWGITPMMAKELRLGYTEQTVSGDFIPRPWNTSPRITVPLFGFDKTPRGLQGRALQDNDPTRWCSLSNPLDTAWSRLGVFAHDHGDDYVQLGEGPGDALTAYATGASAVFLRGTSLAMGAINQIIAGCSGKVVILAGDSDTAGQIFNAKMGEALVEAGIEVRILNLKDFSDVTEWREDNPNQFVFGYHKALRSAPLFEKKPFEPQPQEPVGKSYKLTEQGNGERLVDKMDGTISFCPQIGRMVYVNGHWQYDELHHAERQFVDLTNEMYLEGDELIDKGERLDNPNLVEKGSRLKGWALRSQNSPIFQNSIKSADHATSIPLSELDTQPFFLNVKNGTVDLRTGQLKEHDPDDWITHRINIDYNPHAESPRWDQFLNEIFPGEPEMPPYIKRIAGYAATGEVRESCLICSIGIGANGKSILWGTIEHVLGDDLAGSVPFSAFEKRQSGSSTADLAYLRGKRLAMVQEGEANTLLAESTIKRATSGSDSISARHLYKSPMKFYPEFLIVMATNSLPRIRGADEGIWRRIRLLRFNRFFEDWERDPYLFETLKGEREGILRWIIEGAKEWYADGLCDPDSVREHTKNYRHTADELAGFIGQVVEEDLDGSIAGAELMELYMDWCVEENIRAWSRRALYEAICERVHGSSKVKKRDGIYILGIKKVT